MKVHVFESDCTKVGVRMRKASAGVEVESVEDLALLPEHKHNV